MDWCPRLRGDLSVERAEGGAEVLVDALLGRRLRLDGPARAITRRLDGHTPLGRLLGDVHAAFPAQTRGQVEHAFRGLLLLGMIEGPGDAVRARAAALRDGSAPWEPVFPGGGRFACQGSGACCQGYLFGPLAEEDIARIEKLDVAGALPHLADRPVFDVREWTQARRELYLVTDGDRCVFLRDDLQCGLHAAFGPDAKPGFCRLYPIQAAPTVDGVLVYDKGECATFSTSAHTGETFAEAWPRLRALLPSRLELEHPIVWLDAVTPCDYAHCLALQRALMALIDGAPAAILSAIGERLRAFRDELRACALTPDGPDEALARALARPVRATASDPPARAFEAVATVAAALAEAARPTEGDTLGASLQARFIALCESVRALALHRADPTARPPGPALRRLLAHATDGADVADVLRLSLRHQLFGRKALLDGRPGPALLRTAFALLVTTTGGRARAASTLAGRVTAAHLDDANMLAQRVLRQSAPVGVLLGHENLLPEVLAALPSLV